MPNSYIPDPSKIVFDWDALRLMVNIKLAHAARYRRQKEDLGYKWLARELGLSDHTISGFIAGTNTPTVRTTMRLMAWVGYTDFAEFLVEE